MAITCSDAPSRSHGHDEETPWTRLSTAFSYATSRVETDKEVQHILGLRTGSYLQNSFALQAQQACFSAGA